MILGAFVFILDHLRDQMTRLEIESRFNQKLFNQKDYVRNKKVSPTVERGWQLRCNFYEMNFE
jgi:hypothetical protein